MQGGWAWTLCALRGELACLGGLMAPTLICRPAAGKETKKKNCGNNIMHACMCHKHCTLIVGVPDLSTKAYQLQKFSEISAHDRALASARTAQSSPVPEIHNLWTLTFSEFWDMKLRFSARSTYDESKMSRFRAVFSSAENGIVKAHSIILDMRIIDVLPCLCSRLPDPPQICPILEALVCITSFMGNIHGYR